MDVNITTRKTTLRDNFNERIHKKLGKLDRFFNDDAAAQVTISREGERETVEITITAGGFIFRAERTTDNRFDSLEAVVDALFKQIVKNKDKLERRMKADAFNFIAGSDEGDLEQDTIRIVKNKRFAIKPMDPEEAVLQMNMLGHSFFVFLNVVTGLISVVYKRDRGDYGIIEPDNM